MVDELITVRHGAVLEIRLNRPEKRNALNRPLVNALLNAFEEAEREPAIRAIALTACGPAFCAGGDRSEIPPTTVQEIERASQTLAKLFGIVPSLSKPVVSAVRGPAMGGGACLALSCDMVFLGTSARIAYPEIRNGIAPAVVLPNLIRQIGPKAAFALLATGDQVGSERALALGMVNAIFPDEQVESEALGLATRLAEAAPQAMAAAKRLFYSAADASLGDGIELGRRIVVEQQKRATESAVGR